MEIFRSLLIQVRSIYPSIIIIIITTVFVLCSVVIVSIRTESLISNLTRDPAAVLEFRPHIGFLSNLGIFFWGATVGICLFSALLLKRSDARQFLILSGLFTLYLGIDDVFMLHDFYYPKHLGLHDSIVFAVYLLIMLVITVRYFKVIIESDYILLILGILFFAFSIAVDQIQGDLGIELFSIYTYHLWEDGSKFGGLVSWMVYLSHVAKQSIQRSFN